MSAKLDQSLSEIASSNRRGTGRNNRRRAARSAAVKGAPVGGVRKNTKPAKPAGKGVHNIQSAPPTESKIIVSGLVSLFAIIFSDDTDCPAFRCERRQHQGMLIERLCLGFLSPYCFRDL